MAIIGILHSATNKQQSSIDAFQSELKDLMPGKLVVYAPTFWSDDDLGKLAKNAETLATDKNFDLILVAGGTTAVNYFGDAQRAAGTNTPVVFTTYSRTTSPAANMCGIDAGTSDRDVDRMKEMHKKLKRNTSYGVLENKWRLDYDSTKFENWASPLHITINRQQALIKKSDAAAQITKNIDAAFSAWRTSGITAALVASDPIINDHREDVKSAAKLLNAAPITTMHQWHDWVTGGHGDMAYGRPMSAAYKLAASAAQKVLNGMLPSAVGVTQLSGFTNYP